MVIALIAIVLQLITLGLNSGESVNRETETVNELVNEYNSGCMCDDCYWTECYEEAVSEFDALFNSYEVKRAKNGAMMIRSGNSGSYTFAKKG